MPEEGRLGPWARRSWTMLLRLGQQLLPPALLGLTVAAIYCFFYCGLCKQPQERSETHIAELQLNITGSWTGPTLHWEAGPALGRSFIHGPGLEKGQLLIHLEGIYRLHVQVTLANCSSTCSTKQHGVTLAVGICSPTAHSVSLLRRNFQQDCTVALQRLTRLARGDVLCANLSLPLRPSLNADETFFSVQWVYP
ncbi:CD70 antigen [Psammomys obesus]|uniref:CD70 antigen n=1 Tax=Psammomys obesus TaxID=48139 RepID=UPI0024535421|nr:CD70 antigen [Psammomys obesus]